jgi:hypothetical protein
VMVHQLTMPPPPLQERVPTIPREIEQVVLRALAKDPKARFATMGAIAAYMRLVANVSLKQRDRPVADGENDSG